MTMGSVVTLSRSLVSMHHLIASSRVRFAVATRTASVFGASLQTDRGHVCPVRRHRWIRSSGFSTTTTLGFFNNVDFFNYYEGEKWSDAWLEEQPTLCEELLVAETVLLEEVAAAYTLIAAADSRYLQVLDRVCAASPPRVAFERRLDHLMRKNPWNCCYESDGDVRAQDREMYEFAYEVNYGMEFNLYDVDGVIAFLSKDHGNHVYIDWTDKDKYEPIYTQKIFLSVVPDDLESLNVNWIKSELKRRKLSDSGKKTDLLARLQKFKEGLKEEPDFECMTVAELKIELGSRGLSVSGKKADLVSRLQQLIQ
jgi:hypothetical protein